MKRTLSFMVMALALLLTQCRKPEVKFPSPVAPEGTTVSMTVTAGPGSKTDISTAGGITWSTGDKLYVGYDGKYVGYLTLTSGQNTPTGWFSGNVTLPNGTTGEQPFRFFYLGSAERTLTVGATTVDVDFSSQEIYAEDGKLKNASRHHVGYGSAKGTVKDGVVTGINVTMVSKVALAWFSFTDGTNPYTGQLTLSGTGIYNKMTVRFDANDFSFSGTSGDISLTNTTTEKKYVMLVPASTSPAKVNFSAGGDATEYEFGQGIEANKFYGRDGAIEVAVKVEASSPGEIKGPFSVSSTQKVVFSTGNLQYIGTNDDKPAGVELPYWRFAPNQWDKLLGGPNGFPECNFFQSASDYWFEWDGESFCLPGNVTIAGVPTGTGPSPDKTNLPLYYNCDLTCYGNSDSECVAKYYKSVSGPDAEASKAVIDLFAYGATGGSNVSKPYSRNYKDNSADSDSDWGKFLTKDGGSGIYVGNTDTKVSGGWRLLTKDEWEFLRERTNSEGKYLVGRVKLTDVAGATDDQYGLVILPDDSEYGFEGVVTSGYNVIIEMTCSDIAKYKAVFLPCSYSHLIKDNSLFIGQLYNEINNLRLYYWCSSAADRYWWHYTICDNFNNKTDEVMNSLGEETACVRLVKNIE